MAKRHRTDIARRIDAITPELRSEIRAVIGGEKPWPLVLFGEAGTGKTCAALCMLDYAGGDYFTVYSLCARLIQSQQGRLEWSQEGRGGVIWPDKFWSMMASQPLVVMDELGCRDRPSDPHYEAVKEVIEIRAGKPLVVISNHGLERIAQLYDARIASRLAAGTVFCLDGEDRRLA